MSTVVKLSFIAHGDDETGDVTRMAVSLAKDLRTLDGVLAVFLETVVSEREWMPLADQDLDIEPEEFVAVNTDGEPVHRFAGGERDADPFEKPTASERQRLEQRTGVIHERGTDG